MAKPIQPKPAREAERRAAAKQASRAADELALEQGRVSSAELEAKNAFVLAGRTVVHWKRSKPL